MNKTLSVKNVNRIRISSLFLIDQLVEKFNLLTKGEPGSIYRLTMMPMLYAYWERFFVQINNELLNFIVKNIKKNAQANTLIYTLLLLNTNEYNSFYDKIKDEFNDKKLKKSKFSHLQFLIDFQKNWNQQTPILLDDKKYIMTFSNINEQVVRFHENLFELGLTNSIQDGLQLDISMLGEIVGKRNDIAHGSFNVNIGELELENYCHFLKILIESYFKSVCLKIESYKSH